MKFWEKYCEVCEKNNTRPNTVGKFLGISPGTINSWKNGSIPNGETLIKLAEYFDCSIDYLLGKTEEPNRNKLVFKMSELLSSLSDEEINFVCELIEFIKQKREK